MESRRAPTETETEYVSRVLRVVRQFVRRHGVHVWMVVHPTKLYRNEKGKYPIPTLYDCMGSAHWRNKADNGICVWRDLSDRADREVVAWPTSLALRSQRAARCRRLTPFWVMPRTRRCKPLCLRR